MRRSLRRWNVCLKSRLLEKWKNSSRLCKRRGFIFQSSEIYGGLNGFWDYGPLGVELKRNVKDAWWHDIVRAPSQVLMAIFLTLWASIAPLS